MICVRPAVTSIKARHMSRTVHTVPDGAPSGAGRPARPRAAETRRQSYSTAVYGPRRRVRPVRASSQASSSTS